MWDKIPGWITEPCPGRTTCGRRRLQARRHVLPVLRGVDMGQQQLGDRTGHQHHIWTRGSRLQPGRPGAGHPLGTREQLQRDRSGHCRGCRRDAVDGVRFVLDRNPDGAAGVAIGEAIGRPDPAAPRGPQGLAQCNRGGLHLPHDGWYYLFTSWGQCCQGARATTRSWSDAPRASPDRTSTGTAARCSTAGAPLADPTGDRFGPGRPVGVRGDHRLPLLRRERRGAPTLALQRVSWAEDGWPRLGA